MPFKKGQSGNPGGRPKGSGNKSTSDLRTWINDFLDKNLNKIQKDFTSLDPKDRLIFFEKLLKYAVPALSSVDATINYENLSDQQLDDIISKLIKADNEKETKN